MSQMDIFGGGLPPTPPVLEMPEPFPGMKQYHQHSPELLDVVKDPWKRLSNCKASRWIVVVGSIHWQPTDRDIDLYQITVEGLRALLDFQQKRRPQGAVFSKLARTDDPRTSVVSGKLTLPQIYLPGYQVHKILKVMAQ